MSPAGYWIAGGILLIGCGAAIVWFVLAIVGQINAPDDFDRIAIPGTKTLTLDEGEWVVYYESTLDWGSYYTPPSVTVSDARGRDVALRYHSSSSYTQGGRRGESLWSFDAPTSGAYTIDVATVGEPVSTRGGQIAVGRPLFSGGAVASILGSIALGAVSFIAGLVVLIVTIVRRGRAKRPLPGPYGSGAHGGVPGMVPYGGPSPYGSPSAPAGWPPPAPAAPSWPPPPGPPPPSTPGPPPPPEPPPPSPWSPPDQTRTD